MVGGIVCRSLAVVDFSFLSLTTSYWKTFCDFPPENACLLEMTNCWGHWTYESTSGIVVVSDGFGENRSSKIGVGLFRKEIQFLLQNGYSLSALCCVFAKKIDVIPSSLSRVALTTLFWRKVIVSPKVRKNSLQKNKTVNNGILIVVYQWSMRKPSVIRKHLDHFPRWWTEQRQTMIVGIPYSLCCIFVFLRGNPTFSVVV